jgi:hypothetical protein
LIALAAGLVAASVLVYFFRFDLEEPRRCLMALATLGFFFAPLSDIPLRVGLWLLAVAVVAWGAQIAGSGWGGFPLWLACSVAGALLVVRGGSRAARYYLPEAGSETGRALQRDIRIQLQISVLLFLVGYVFNRWFGTLLVALSAAFFVRYVLLQSKHLGIAATPLPIDPGIVPSQRWALLVLFAVVGGTRLPRALLGEDQSSLLLTAALLLVTAALLFVLSLTRTGWPRTFVRRASFAAGIVLAVAVTAVLVELESWDRSGYRVFASFCMSFLVVLPFLARQTKLLAASPRLAALVPPPALSVMMAPVTAVSGLTASSSSSTAVFLFAFAVLLLAYHLLVDLREKARSGVYLAASLGLSIFLFVDGAGDRGWQVFLLSLGFVLYAIDRLERVWRESRSHVRIPTQ